LDGAPVLPRLCRDLRERLARRCRRTAEPLTPGRRVLLELELPDGRPLEAIGRVAWTRRVLAPRERDSEAGIGIEFLGGPSDQFSLLEELIDKLADGVA
jgi:hypothetical protein